jgi:hypothetical protein
MPRSSPRTRVGLIGIALVGALAACGDAGEPDPSVSKAGEVTVAPDIAYARASAPGIELGRGFNSLTNTFVDRTCVGAMRPSRPVISSDTSLRLIAGEETLTTELGISPGTALASAVTRLAGAGAAPTGPSLMDLVNGFRASHQTVTYLLHAKVSYEILNDGGVDPRFVFDRGATPQAVLRQCGDRYVSALRYELEYAATIEFETDSLDDYQSFTAGISIPDKDADGKPLTPEERQRLTQEALASIEAGVNGGGNGQAHTRREARVHTYARGFVGTDPPFLCLPDRAGGGITPETTPVTVLPSSTEPVVYLGVVSGNGAVLCVQENL